MSDRLPEMDFSHSLMNELKALTKEYQLRLGDSEKRIADLETKEANLRVQINNINDYIVELKEKFEHWLNIQAELTTKTDNQLAELKELLNIRSDAFLTRYTNLESVLKEYIDTEVAMLDGKIHVDPCIRKLKEIQKKLSGGKS